ncbi:MAG: hypothetical protein PVJ67_00840 [Candidatus Pacearchaeota archaeon]|jgi:type I site-specific restriction-modification system R (restriction) subunit
METERYCREIAEFIRGDEDRIKYLVKKRGIAFGLLGLANEVREALDILANSKETRGRAYLKRKIEERVKKIKIIKKTIETDLMRKKYGGLAN